MACIIGVFPTALSVHFLIIYKEALAYCVWNMATPPLEESADTYPGAETQLSKWRGWD